MSKVDFYGLPVGEPHARLLFACRLAERAWHEGHRVWLHGADGAMAEALDELMWTFRDTSFVPHERAPGSTGCPVLIGCGADEPSHHDVLINLADEVPQFYGRFARVAEIVLNDDQAKATLRARWKLYRDAGHTLEHHAIASMRGAGGH